MTRLIDLTMDIFAGTPVFEGFPPVEQEVVLSHEGRAGRAAARGVSPIVTRLALPDHCATHVDAFCRLSPTRGRETSDTMPLERFYTEAICLDLSHVPPRGLIEVADVEAALARDGLDVRPGDTVLLHTGHHKRTWGTSAFLTDWPGISAEVARWFGERRVAAFGVESLRPGIIGVSNEEVHRLGWRDGRHPLREPGEPGPARRARSLPLHRLPAQDPRRRGEPCARRGRPGRVGRPQLGNRSWAQKPSASRALASDVRLSGKSEPMWKTS